MMASVVMLSNCARNSSLTLIFSGWTIGRPSASAARFTGDSASCMPRPLGRSGWVATSFTPKPAATSFSSVGTANGGVPQKTKSIMSALPFALLYQLADLALHHVSLQGADVADIELAVEMVGFVHQRARQQFLSAHLDGLAFHVLCARRNRAWPRHLLAEFGQTQAAFVGSETPFGVDDLGIDQHDLGARIFLEADVDHRNALADADLRRCQTDAVCHVHALKHIFDQFSQLVVEHGDGGRRILQNRVPEFHDFVDHLEVSQLLAVAFEIPLH